MRNDHPSSIGFVVRGDTRYCRSLWDSESRANLVGFSISVLLRGNCGRVRDQQRQCVLADCDVQAEMLSQNASYRPCLLAVSLQATVRVGEAKEQCSIGFQPVSRSELGDSLGATPTWLPISQGHAQ